MAIKLHSSFVIHTGEWLRTESVKPHGLNGTLAADKLGVTRQAMGNGKTGLSADMAIGFEKAFGLSTDTLARMQTTPDLVPARTHEKDIMVERVTMAS